MVRGFDVATNIGEGLAADETPDQHMSDMEQACA